MKKEDKLKKNLLIKPKNSPVSVETLQILNQIKVKLSDLHSIWTPHDAQKPVLNAIFKEGKKTVFCRSGRRSGKTDVSIYVALRKAILAANSKILIVTPTLKQAKKVYWKSGKVHQMIPKNWNCHITNDDLTIKFDNGSYIEIDGSDDIESHRGAEYDVVIIDEFKDIKPEFYSEIINPTLATTNGTLVIIGTPPKNRNNHYFELEASVVGDKDWGFFHWTSFDNPYVSKKWLETEEKKYIARGEIDVWKREFLAEYCFGGKDQVFPMFSRKKHLKPLDTILDIMKRDWSRFEWITSCDPATSSTFAVLFSAYDRGSNRLFILDEIYATDKNLMTTGNIYEAIKKKQSELNTEADWAIVYDEAASWFSNEVSSRFGDALFPSAKSRNNKEDGLSLIKDLMLKENGITIANHCKNTIFEIENYIMDNGRYPKNNDHEIDNLRYTLGFLNLDFSLHTPEFYDNTSYVDRNDDNDLYYEKDNILSLKEYYH